jgi:hypothetical protein
MPGEQKRVDALQLIFSVFLGALLVILIGVGVWTFYPQPYGSGTAQEEEIQSLYQQQEQIRMNAGSKALTPLQNRKIEQTQDQIDELNKQMQVARDAWAVNTSIILLIFATILMAISLFLPDHMRVFSNGVLLGGLFSVVYGTGWSFAGGDSRARFFVVLVALLLAVAFGYLRFIRGRQDKAEVAARAGAMAGAGGPAAVDGTELAALTARVDALEARSAAAAAALGGETD